jgi:hypothetical protein
MDDKERSGANAGVEESAPVATVRGDIQKGLAGDKKPGFDPAVAPMETDAEAGGVPLTAQGAKVDRANQRNVNRADHQGTYASAMRPNGAKDVRLSSKIIVMIATLIVASAAFAVLLLI